MLEELAASLHCLLLVKTTKTILDMQLAHWFQVHNISQFDSDGVDYGFWMGTMYYICLS